jgi:hypothetical protein
MLEGREKNFLTRKEKKTLISDSFITFFSGI